MYSLTVGIYLINTSLHFCKIKKISLFKQCLFPLVVFTIVCLRVSAQTESPNLEFIENKGQWDSQAILKADIGNGSLFFHKRGIRVVLHNEQEMAVMVASHAGLIRSDTAKHKSVQRNF